VPLLWNSIGPAPFTCLTRTPGVAQKVKEAHPAEIHEAAAPLAEACCSCRNDTRHWARLSTASGTVIAGLSDSSVRTCVVPFSNAVGSAAIVDRAVETVAASEKSNAATYLGKCDLLPQRFDYGQRRNASRRCGICLRKELEHLEKTKANIDDVVRAMQLATWYDNHERDDRKRNRDVKLIGNAVRSDEEVEYITTFIQTLEQLNERDLIVLRILNKVMNKVGDWKPATTSTGMATVHPNNFIHRSEELVVQVALALEQSVETNQPRRRVQHLQSSTGIRVGAEIEMQQRELPLTNYCFRLSVQGVQLLKLLGEDVPNCDYYLRKTDKDLHYCHLLRKFFGAFAPIFVFRFASISGRCIPPAKLNRVRSWVHSPLCETNGCAVH
jgi:hypothetical protein